MADAGLTVTDILAAATRLLETGGYRRAERDLGDAWPSGSARVFEDAYSIVAVVAFETWSSLSTSWPDAQAALVELISAAVSNADPKAWDGYLVLLTPGEPSDEQRADAGEIRYNTSRLRKLVATGRDLSFLSDVERALSPLLPLNVDVEATDRASVLELLPDLLAPRGARREDVRVLLDAFHAQQPLIEALHRRSEGEE